MRIIIPAAGKGTRLRPLTESRPKCLVQVNGKPILFYLLSNLKKLEVNEVIIVTGYQHTLIENYAINSPHFPPVKFIHNAGYDHTNSIVSLSLTMDLWEKDFCIIDSDLLVKFELLQQLITSESTCLFVDNSKSIEDIDMRVKAKNGRLIYLDRELEPSETYGEFTGMSRWTPAAAQELRKSIELILGQNNKTVWYEWAIRHMAGNYVLPIQNCSSDCWIEIDSVSDHEKATALWGEKIV